MQHALGEDVAAQNTAEDVDQHRLDVWVGHQDAKGIFDPVGIGGAANVQKIGRRGARQLDDVHRGHGQAGAVDDAADVAGEFDVREAVSSRFDFQRVFLGGVAQRRNVGVAEQGVVVELHLGVQNHRTVVGRQDQRVDLQQGAVLGAEHAVELLQQGRQGALRRSADGEIGDKPAGLETGQADQHVDRGTKDFIGVLSRHRLDVHAPGGAEHQGRLAGGAIDEQAAIQLLGDVAALFNENLPHCLALRTCLRRHQAAAQQLAGVLLHLRQAAGPSDTAALAAPAGVDLRLDDPAVAAERLGRMPRLRRGARRRPGRDGHAVLAQDRLGLVLVDFSRLFLLRRIHVQTARHSGESRSPVSFWDSGFRVKPGMTTWRIERFNQNRKCSRGHWIPACAGMTIR